MSVMSDGMERVEQVVELYENQRNRPFKVSTSTPNLIFLNTVSNP